MKHFAIKPNQSKRTPRPRPLLPEARPLETQRSSTLPRIDCYKTEKSISSIKSSTSIDRFANDRAKTHSTNSYGKSDSLNRNLHKKAIKIKRIFSAIISLNKNLSSQYSEDNCPQ